MFQIVYLKKYMRLFLSCIGLILALLQPANSHGSVAREGLYSFNAAHAAPFFLEHSHNEHIYLDDCLIEETNDDSHDYKRKVSFVSKTFIHSYSPKAGFLHASFLKKLPEILVNSVTQERSLCILISVFRI